MKDRLLELSTHNLVLAHDAAIDLQTHTVYSDGTWTPTGLIDYLLSAGFALAAITDHDRVDTAAELQRLACEKHFPLLVATEMTTSWKGAMTDVLCFGFEAENSALGELAGDVFLKQQANTRMIYDKLLAQGYTFPARLEGQPPDTIETVLQTPSARQPHELVAFLKRHGYGTEQPSAGKIITEAGFEFVTNPLEDVVEAARQSGGVCLLAHPGRSDEGFIPFDVDRLDEVRSSIPLDGLEVYYPLHTPEQTTMFLEYAHKHSLLTSSGSDSHGPEKKPIAYPAELSRGLLERLGIRVQQRPS